MANTWARGGCPRQRAGPLQLDTFPPLSMAWGSLSHPPDLTAWPLKALRASFMPLRESTSPSLLVFEVFCSSLPSRAGCGQVNLVLASEFGGTQCLYRQRNGCCLFYRPSWAAPHCLHVQLQQIVHLVHLNLGLSCVDIICVWLSTTTASSGILASNEHFNNK